jgi:peroxiredoxin Q/BCP
MRNNLSKMLSVRSLATHMSHSDFNPKARRADRQTSAQPGRAGVSTTMKRSAVGAAPYVLFSLLVMGLLPWNAAIANTAATDLQPGAKAPAFTLPSQDGTPISLSDYRGKWVVLYFYPKDKSSGCTIQAHAYQSNLPQFESHNAVVLGVSLDTADSHKSFCAEDGLTFKLLADPQREAAAAYGVPLMTFKDMKFDERDTFLIAPDGKIAQVWRKVDPREDSKIVLQAIATHTDR